MQKLVCASHICPMQTMQTLVYCQPKVSLGLVVLTLLLTLLLWSTSRITSRHVVVLFVHKWYLLFFHFSFVYFICRWHQCFLFWRQCNSYFQVINFIKFEMGKVATWLQANRHSLNLDKCICMIFQKKKTIFLPSPDCQVEIIEFKLSRCLIPNFWVFMLIVVLLRSFTYIVKEVENKVSKSIGVISRLKHYSPM